jgi:hypothetical protein
MDGRLRGPVRPSGLRGRARECALLDADLEDMRARIAATRWPERETVDEESQGVQLATIQALAPHWLTQY